MQFPVTMLQTCIISGVVYQNINLCQKKGGLKRYGEDRLESMRDTLEVNPECTSKLELVTCIQSYLRSVHANKQFEAT